MFQTITPSPSIRAKALPEQSPTAAAVTRSVLTRTLVSIAMIAVTAVILG